MNGKGPAVAAARSSVRRKMRFTRPQNTMEVARGAMTWAS
jgi:hypothetical protein